MEVVKVGFALFFDFSKKLDATSDNSFFAGMQ